MKITPQPGRGHAVRATPLVKLALIVTSWAALSSCLEPAETDATPGDIAPPARALNVLLISLDTLRADHLGLYGHHRDTSPFLDQLAERALVFEQAFAPIHGTLPSHMSMLTGLLPWHHGVYPPAGVLPDDIPLLQELLSRAGYVTGGFTEGGYVHGGYGFARGFDEFDHDSKKIETDIERTLAKGRAFLDKVGEVEAPFFLFLHSYVAHDPYFPSGSLAEQLSPRALPPMHYNELFGPPIPAEEPFPTGPVLSAHNAGEFTMNERRIALYEAAYDRSIRYLDDQLAEFWRFLEERGVLEDTLVLITADHGEEFGEHGRLAHTQIYREVLQVPLIVLAPGIVAGREATPVGLIDLTPTVLGFLGLGGLPEMSAMDGTALPLAPPPTGGGASWENLAGRPILAEQLDETRRSVVVQRPGLGAAQFIQRFDRRQEWHSYAAQVRTVDDLLELEVRSYDEPREITVTSHQGQTLYRGMLEANRWSSLRLDLTELRKPATLELRSATCDAPTEFWNRGRNTCRSFQLRRASQWNTELYDLEDDPAQVFDLSLEYPELVDELQRKLRWERQRAPRTELDPALEERLKALGYLQ